jgi:hypothetical protein
MMFGFRPVTDNACFQMIRQQFDPERIERGAYRGNLVQYIDTILVFVDHALDAAYLPGNPIDPCFNLIFPVFLHHNQYTAMGEKGCVDRGEMTVLH